MDNPTYRKAVLQLLIAIAKAVTMNSLKLEVMSGVTSAIGYAEESLKREG